MISGWISTRVFFPPKHTSLSILYVEIKVLQEHIMEKWSVSKSGAKNVWVIFHKIFCRSVAKRAVCQNNVPATVTWVCRETGVWQLCTPAAREKRVLRTKKHCQRVIRSNLQIDIRQSVAREGPSKLCPCCVLQKPVAPNFSKLLESFAKWCCAIVSKSVRWDMNCRVLPKVLCQRDRVSVFYKSVAEPSCCVDYAEQCSAMVLHRIVLQKTGPLYKSMEKHGTSSCFNVCYKRDCTKVLCKAMLRKFLQTWNISPKVLLCDRGNGKGIFKL